MNWKRTLAFGDIHGCLDELKDLLDKLNYDPSTDRVILVGDLVDRGPYSAATVRYARNMKFEVVMGNHDEKYVRYAKHERKRTLNSDFENPMKTFTSNPLKMEVFNSLTEEDIQFLSLLPGFIRVDVNFVAVHAGFLPNAPIARQKTEVMTHVRHLDNTTNKMCRLNEDFSTPTNSYFWAERWRGPESVVYGHNVHSLTNVMVHEFVPNVKCYGIDKGVVYGGHLTALVYDNAEKRVHSFEQVPARRQYWKKNSGSLSNE